VAIWKELFEEHLNEGSKSEQQTRPVDLRDDGVENVCSEPFETLQGLRQGDVLSNDAFQCSAGS
jgi:hypothetical protein